MHTKNSKNWDSNVSPEEVKDFFERFNDLMKRLDSEERVGKSKT